MDIVEAGLARFQILRAWILPTDLAGNAQRADVAKRNIDCAFQLAIVEPPISDLGVAFKLSGRRLGIHQNRSEEHTSELQSLMRISYAVFCLKKKKKNIHNKVQTKETHN